MKNPRNPYGKLPPYVYYLFIDVAVIIDTRTGSSFTLDYCVPSGGRQPKIFVSKTELDHMRRYRDDIDDHLATWYNRLNSAVRRGYQLRTKKLLYAQS